MRRGHSAPPCWRGVSARQPPCSHGQCDPGSDGASPWEPVALRKKFFSQVTDHAEAIVGNGCDRSQVDSTRTAT